MPLYPWIKPVYPSINRYGMSSNTKNRCTKVGEYPNCGVMPNKEKGERLIGFITDYAKRRIENMDWKEVSEWLEESTYDSGVEV
jgi:hypothetical protein